MADRVIFCMWGRAIPGREEAGIAAFRDASAICERLQAAGEIESHDVVVFDPYGGMGGFMLIKGEGEKLARLAADPEWVQACLRGNVSMEDFGLLSGTTGMAAMTMLEAFRAATAAVA